MGESGTLGGMSLDEGLRKNPSRYRQLASIGEQLAIARGKQTSVARMIERLESRP